MVNYGQKDEYLFAIPNVDHQIDVAYLKINQWSVFPVCMVPLYLEQGLIALLMAISLYCFFFWASRREDEGRPVTLNPTLIRVLSFLPSVIRTGAFPSISSIKPYFNRYRR